MGSFTDCQNTFFSGDSILAVPVGIEKIEMEKIEIAK